MRILVVAAVLGTMVCPEAGWTQDRGISVGNGFYARCKSPTNEINAASCMAYLRGLVDGVVGTWGLGCSPQSATYQQRYDILLKYLADYPASRHLEMTAIYSVAMMTAFCPLPPMVEIETLDPPKR